MWLVFVTYMQKKKKKRMGAMQNASKALRARIPHGKFPIHSSPMLPDTTQFWPKLSVANLS